MSTEQLVTMRAADLAKLRAQLAAAEKAIDTYRQGTVSWQATAESYLQTIKELRAQLAAAEQRVADQIVQIDQFSSVERQRDAAYRDLAAIKAQLAAAEQRAETAEDLLRKMVISRDRLVELRATEKQELAALRTLIGELCAALDIAWVNWVRFGPIHRPSCAKFHRIGVECTCGADQIAAALAKAREVSGG